MRLYMPIQKTEELSDGTLLVTGIASSEAVDADGEVIKASAIKAALPDFFRYGTGALREMHQSIAAGTVDKAEVADGVTTVECTVVDPVAIQKVKTGTYKGFSIGGRTTARDPDDKKLITGIRLVEVSLVDRPANPDAVIELWKADTAEEQPVPEDPKALRKSRVAELAALLDQGGDAMLVKLLDAAKAAVAPKEPEVAAPVAKAEEAPAVEAAAAPAGDPPIEAAEQQAESAPVVEAQKLSGADLRKGMYSLHQLVEVCNALACAASDSEFEAQWEGDGSPVPARLRGALAECASILLAMTAEETAELMSDLMPKEAAAAAGDLAKAEPPADAAPAVEAAGAATEPTAASASDVAKAALVEDALAKALAAVAKVEEALAKANARLEVLEAQPAPGKALLKAIGKGEDVIDTNTPTAVIEPVKKTDGSTDDAATLIKSIHARGGIPVRFA